MRSPSNLKEVQHLNRKLVALSRFLPRLADKTKPFFRLIKGTKKFKWNAKCENMLQSMKRKHLLPNNIYKSIAPLNLFTILVSLKHDHKLEDKK